MPIRINSVNITDNTLNGSRVTVERLNGTIVYQYTYTAAIKGTLSAEIQEIERYLYELTVTFINPNPFHVELEIERYNNGSNVGTYTYDIPGNTTWRRGIAQADMNSNWGLEAVQSWSSYAGNHEGKDETFRFELGNISGGGGHDTTTTTTTR